MSVPPATEMFQFAGFASRPYRFGAGYHRVKPGGGLPHSEIPGSPIARISPGLFAACHVLPRLSVPRHPPDALCLRFHKPPHTAASPGPAVQETSPVPAPMKTPGTPGAQQRQTPGLPPRSLQLPLHPVNQHPANTLGHHPRVKHGASSGGGDRVRTDDLLLAKQALCRLSYTPARLAAALVGRPGGPGRI
jgi:hypothetical protein